ncbi:enoyl-CoA hydratase/isomerase family protein [Allokutzneria multivorans]|uniref:3-hydroxyisobutyryl-CoA hydrolase n=1 Tax=Allokutzneria multivorans TaxID=1142134 RepID=A0ABP7QVS9_9PSEU
MMTTDVLLRKESGLGRIILNRPRAINALTHTMVQLIDAALVEWADDADVRAVLITGAGERGLCAGGDIVSIYEDARSGGSASLDFWRDEYVLNARIARYPKPYVAVMDGIVMGGGVGVSAHGSVRIVTERSVVGMPEVGIGFVPDVGGTYLLSRAPGELGTHIALTTARFGAGDAVHCGFADHFVPSASLDDFVSALSVDGLEAALSLASAAPASALVEQRSWIDSCYAADSVQEIVDRLQDHDSTEAKSAAEQILGKSPTALTVTLRALRQARRLPSLEEALDQEFRVANAILRSHDLAEGIRAQVIDKDRDPRWKPATLADVSTVDEYFADLGARELGLAQGEI